MSTAFLRQSTASQSRILGPFLSDSDGATAQTSLTIANTDVKLMPGGGASQNKNSGGGTHRVNGMYSVTFDATDTAAVGPLDISVKMSGALPVFQTFWVLEEAVYDELFAASAPGAATVSALSTVATGVSDIQSRIPTALVSGRMSSDAVAISGDTTAASQLKSAFNDTPGAIPWTGIIEQGTAVSATAAGLVMRSGAPTFGDNALVGSFVFVFSSTLGYAQVGYVSGNVGSTKALTFTPSLAVAPTGTVLYRIFGAPAGSSSAAELAVAVVDQSLSGHTTTGTVGKALSDAATASSPSTIATAVRDVALAGAAANSLGERISRSPNVAAGSTGGLVLVGTGSGAINPSGGKVPATIAAGDIATNAVDANAVKQDAVDKINSGQATAANLATLQTTADGIKAKTDNLPNNGALTSIASAANLALLDAKGDAIKAVTDKLDTALEDDGSSGWQYTALAVENAPAGEGGGSGSGLTSDQWTVMRNVIGIPSSGTTPTVPTEGVLAIIRDDVEGQNDLSSAEAQDAAQAGALAALEQYDPPSNSEMTAAIAQVPTAAQNADALLARNQRGGSNGPAGQTVADAIAGGLGLVTIQNGVLTVRHGDGTVAFTRAVTRADLQAITSLVAA